MKTVIQGFVETNIQITEAVVQGSVSSAADLQKKFEINAGTTKT